MESVDGLRPPSLPTGPTKAADDSIKLSFMRAIPSRFQLTIVLSSDDRALSRYSDCCPVGPGLPWPVVWGADMVVFAVSVMVLLSP
jgi:hypothetical protein